MAATAGALASVTAHEQAEGGAQHQTNQSVSPVHPLNVPSPESTDIFDPHPHLIPSTTGGGENDDECADEFRSLMSPRPGQITNAERIHLVRSASPNHHRLHHHHHRRYPHHRRRPHKSSEPTYPQTTVNDLLSSDTFHDEIENEDNEDGYTTSLSQQSDNTLLQTHRSPYPTIGQKIHRPYSRTLSGTKLGTSSGASAGGTSSRNAAKYSASSESPSIGNGPYYLPTSIHAEGYIPSAVELADLPPLGSPLRVPHLSTSSSNGTTAKMNRGEHSSGGGSTERVDAAKSLFKSSTDALNNFVNKPRGSDAAQTIPQSPSFADLMNKKRRLSQRAQQQFRSTYYQLVPTAEKDEPKQLAFRTPSPRTPTSPTARLRRHASLSAVAEQKQAAVHEMFKQQMPMERKMPAKVRAYHRLLRQHSGHYNMIVSNIPHRRARLIYDLWNTLVDLKWRDIILLFLLSYFVTWLLFGLLYYLVAISHGDLDAKNIENTEWDPCVLNLNSFTTAYLFSFESQHTIGYGFRHITDQCPNAIIILCFQSALGAGLQAFMIGLVFTRIQRPTRRAQTLLFSKNVCVCTRDGQLCLLFRIGNMRRSLIIHSRVTAHLVHHRKTLEGELLPLHQHELYVQLDSMASSATAHHHLAWPMTACHIINAESPLYDMDMDALAEARFELIVTLEGVIESTGQALEARMSYLPSEILWGYRFAPLISYRLRTDNYHYGPKSKARVAGQYVVDFEHFNELEKAKQTPTCSAAEFELAKRTKLASVSHQPSPFVVTSRQSSTKKLSIQSSESETDGLDEEIVPFESQPELSPVHSNSGLKQYQLKATLEAGREQEEFRAAMSGRRRSSVQFLSSAPHSILEDDEHNATATFKVGEEDEHEQQELDLDHHKRKNAVRRKKSSLKSRSASTSLTLEISEAAEMTSLLSGSPPELVRPISQRVGRHQPRQITVKTSLQTTRSAPQSLQDQTQSRATTTAAVPATPNSLRPLLNLLQTEMSMTALATPTPVTSRSSSSATVVPVVVNTAEEVIQPGAINHELTKRKLSCIQRANLIVPEIIGGVEPSEENERISAEQAMARRRRLGSLLDDPNYTFDLEADSGAMRHRLKTSISTTTRSLLPTIEQDVESNIQQPRNRKFSFAFRRQTPNDEQNNNSSVLLTRTKPLERRSQPENVLLPETAAHEPAERFNKSSTSRRKFSVDSLL